MSGARRNTPTATLVAAVPSSQRLPGEPGDGGGATLIAGRYELSGLLGVGGMGSVYRALDRELGEVVALKMLGPELLSDQRALEQFREEVRLARRVTSPNVARTFDIGDHQGGKFITMELVAGESLAAEMKRESTLAVGRVVAVGIEVCKGLAAAHAVGVVHRDLKPENVLLAHDGGIKVTDFGLARLCAEDREGEAPVGTPAYMAPEQLTADASIDPRADLYALGVMLFEMLAGRLPWAGASTVAGVFARLVTPPPDVREHCPEVPEGLAVLIRRCMATHREERPTTATEVIEEFRAVIESPGYELSALLRQTRAMGGLGPHKHVAVLPIEDRGATLDDHVADGLTEELIDNLAMVKGLRVRASRAVMKYKGNRGELQDLGRELRVDVIVDGSVRRTYGDAVLVRLRLVSVSDGLQFWTKQYARPTRDLLGIGEEAARSIGEALAVEMPGKGRTARDPAAVELVVRARAEFNTSSSVGEKRAIALLEQALTRLPDDPLILSTFAVARLLRLDLRADQGDVVKESLRMAERAVLIAPELPEAHVALAKVRLHVGHYASAARAAMRAVEKGPSNADAHAIVGGLLSECGYLDEALQRLEICRSIDPRMTIVLVECARIHALLSDWRRVDELMAGAATDDSPFIYWTNLFRFYMWRGDSGASAALVEAAQQSALRDHVVLRGYSALLNGRLPPPGFEEAFDQVSYTVRRRLVTLQARAERAAYRGDLATTCSVLDACVAAGLIDLAWLERCPLLDGVRSTAGYATARATVARRADAILAVVLALDSPA